MAFINLWLFSLSVLFAQEATKEYACPKIRVTPMQVVFTDMAQPYVLSNPKDSKSYPLSLGWKIFPGGLYTSGPAPGGREESIPSELMKVENVGGVTTMTCSATYNGQNLVVYKAFNESDVKCSIKPGAMPNSFTCKVRSPLNIKKDEATRVDNQAPTSKGSDPAVEFK